MTITYARFTVAYWCVLIAALLPLACSWLAKFQDMRKPRSQGGYDNADPRAWLARQQGWKARANAAQANTFEALPFFFAAVIIAHQLGAPQTRLDILATDHAPHLLDEKAQPYTRCPSGIPLVQFALQSALEQVFDGNLTLERLVETTAHAPATLFAIKDRGFLREGFFADLALIDLDTPQTVKSSDVISKCGWSPFEADTFRSSIAATWVNGHLAWHEGQLDAGEFALLDGGLGGPEAELADLLPVGVGGRTLADARNLQQLRAQGLFGVGHVGGIGRHGGEAQRAGGGERPECRAALQQVAPAQAQVTFVISDFHRGSSPSG